MVNRKGFSGDWFLLLLFGFALFIVLLGLLYAFDLAFTAGKVTATVSNAVQHPPGLQWAPGAAKAAPKWGDVPLLRGDIGYTISNILKLKAWQAQTQAGLDNTIILSSGSRNTDSSSAKHNIMTYQTGWSA